MIRLYESTETAFTSNGLGVLADAYVCEITEDLNGQYELYMEYPIDGLHAADIVCGRLVLVKPNETSNPQPFRIYSVVEASEGKKLSISANHISYDLSGYPVSPFTATGVTPAMTGLVSNSMVANPFVVWTDISNTDTIFNLEAPESFRAALGGTRGSILDSFGGEFEFDGYTVKLHAHRGSDQGVYIRYAKNLSSFENERTAENYTGCLAFWKDSEGQAVYGEIQYVEDHQTYPTEKIFLLDASDDFEDAPEQSDLNARATAYITANGLGAPFGDSLTVSFVPLWQTEEYKNIASLERVSLGDSVHIVYRSYNVTMEVIGYIYDRLAKRYKEIRLGKKKATFADTIKQIVDGETDGVVDEAVSMMDQALNHAMDVISGGTGGYIVIGRNADGQPNELYIMDQPDTGTAVNVLRINYMGMAFSQSGINGPYTTAWTIDSHFVADFITAGELNGNLIRAGSILASALEVAVQTIVQGIKMNFSFLNDGLHIAQKDEAGTIVGAYQTLVSDLGLRVLETASENSFLIAEGDTVTANNLTADQYLRVRADNVASRFQQFYSTAHSEFEFGLFWEVV